jgi:lysophospholipase L1-like esterase
MLWHSQYAYPQESPPCADRQTYLSVITTELRKDWPDNREVNIVCHGHSVPAGYFVTPEVRSLEAYPHLLRVGLAERYPHAVINVIVTAIGGENSESGAKRFSDDVLSHRPDMVAIDYGLNDRGIGLQRARKSWRKMIEEAQSRDIKIILLTPTADLTAKLDDLQDPLNQHAEQIRGLAREYKTGLVDSLAGFKDFVSAGGNLASLMSQSNHPNGAGHKLVAERLLEWFPADGVTRGP